MISISVNWFGFISATTFTTMTTIAINVLYFVSAFNNLISW